MRRLIGVVMRVESAMFVSNTGWLSMLVAKGYGLTASQTLTIGYARAWAKVAYSLPLALPPLRALTFAWFRLCRQCLNTYPAAHSLRVLEAIGILRTPLWWGIKSVINFYIKAFSDDFIQRELAATPEATGKLSRDVTEYLAPCGISWTELRAARDSGPVLHRARVRFIAWVRTQMQEEASRIGWTGPLCMRLNAAKYLQQREGRYGFPFLQDHLGPPERVPANCYFCGAIGQDSGNHLVFDCSEVPTRPTLSRTAWNLTDEAPTADLRVALSWMGLVWRERKKRWKDTGSHISGKRPANSKSFFLTIPAINVSVIPISLPLRRRRRARVPSTIDDPDNPDEPRRQRPRLTELISPTAFLNHSPSPPLLGVAHRQSLQRSTSSQPLTSGPPEPGQPIPAAVRIRVRRRTPGASLWDDEPPAQRPRTVNGRRRPRADETATPDDEPPARRRRVAEELHTVTIALPEGVSLATTPNQAGEVIRKGKWQLDEDEKLIDAIAAGGTIHDYAAAVGTRDVRQVRSRMNTNEFKLKLPTSADATPRPPLRAVRWSDGELDILMRAVNDVRSVHEFERIQVFLPHRTLASLTAKLNTLIAAGKLVRRGDRFVILP